MNHFAIFYVLTTFYSNALAQEEDPDREEVWEIKEAIIHSHTWIGEAYSQVFNHGEVYLYRIWERMELDYYVLEDDSDTDCIEFPIAQYSTVVTDDSITIKWFGQTINLILNANDNTFEFYQKLFPIENFSRDFTGVNELYIDDNLLGGEAAIKAKQVEDNEWCFAVLEDGTPRVIFPEVYVKLSPKENLDTNVSITVDRAPEESIIINLDFDTFIDANAFYLFLKQLGTLQLEYISSR